MSVALVAAVRCHYCSRWLPPSRVHQLGTAARPTQAICDDCFDWHNRAVELLAGEGISGCQGCGASWETLSDRTIGEAVPLYVVPRDGIYQVLCAACLAGYTPKRADLYKGTAYGQTLRM